MGVCAGQVARLNVMLISGNRAVVVVVIPAGGSYVAATAGEAAPASAPDVSAGPGPPERMT